MTEESATLTTTQFVAKLAVKIPDFWTGDPDLWFLHAEVAIQEFSGHAVSNKIRPRPRHPEVASKYHGFRPRVNYELCFVILDPLRGSQVKISLLLHSLALAES